MSQHDAIKQALERGATITPQIAYLEFQCLRLSERIRELEAEGILIDHEWLVTANHKRVMSYRLIRIAYG